MEETTGQELCLRYHQRRRPGLMQVRDDPWRQMRDNMYQEKQCAQETGRSLLMSSVAGDTLRVRL